MPIDPRAEALCVQLEALGASAADAQAILEACLLAYGDAARHYHTVDHLYEVVDTVGRLCAPAPPPAALLLAAWFHDFVYDVRAADNEARSAATAEARLAACGVAHRVAEEVGRLIRLTTHTSAPADADHTGRILLDADLAPLAASPERYAAYSRAIRREYAHVPLKLYAQRRRAILARFLNRPTIYFTSTMRAAAETRARRNLAHEVEQLRRLELA